MIYFILTIATGIGLYDNFKPDDKFPYILVILCILWVLYSIFKLIKFIVVYKRNKEQKKINKLTIKNLEEKNGK